MLGLALGGLYEHLSSILNLLNLLRVQFAGASSRHGRLALDLALVDVFGCRIWFLLVVITSFYVDVQPHHLRLALQPLNLINGSPLGLLLVAVVGGGWSELFGGGF